MVEDLLNQLLKTGGFKIGELTVEKTDRGFTVMGPNSDSESSPRVDCEAEAIHHKVRFDDKERYRPMYSAMTMPSNWHLDCQTVAELVQSLTTIYPLALEHMAAYREGGLTVTPMEQTLERQSGRYSKAAKLSGEGRQIAASTLCNHCIRTPVWQNESVEEGGVPCPEACSLMVAFCREAAAWQDELPSQAEVDAKVDFAAFHKSGNEIREEYLYHLYRDG